ncbi:MAG TPA: S1 RNA-binding domain-containing protein [Phycisphaerae bacterium]|nr:S1 RNA-binding domain-containing protein [Phycisphaerae bacterium]HRY69894.1 S1 RNA-binding domain-containing protein [Phycisphaerae bacterium]HSA29914.1 S1 RNA-binding domain-containing protein [Phycisphaerae bacterium]
MSEMPKDQQEQVENTTPVAEPAAGGEASTRGGQANESTAAPLTCTASGAETAAEPDQHPRHDHAETVEEQAAVQEPQPVVPLTVEAAPVNAADLRQGSIIRAKVTQVTTIDVTFDVAGIQTTIPFIEFAGHPTPKEGDEISVVVEEFDPPTNKLAISKRHADEMLFWHSVQPGDLLEGVVTGMNKGGLDIDIGGARAFLPSSHVDITRIKDISTLIGEHVRCIVTQVDRTTRDLIVSRRKYLERERKEARRKAVDALVEGQKYTGTVSNLTDYGAFVNVGGVDGLVHITDMSWGRVRNPADLLQVGQQVEVLITRIDHQRQKVSLSIKQLKADPWSTAEIKYPVGSRIRSRVARLADFGAFLELEEGIDALLPLSEMSWSRRVNDPSEVVKPGDEIEVIVLRVEPAKQRISVGLKQTEPDPWSTVETRFPLNTPTKGKVSRIMEFGAFVELTPGVEGLIHISELSDKRVKAVGDVVKEGEEVEVRVIRVDTKAQRISLSLRPAPKIQEPPPAAPHKPKPARKKPLRGGLSSHFNW